MKKTLYGILIVLITLVGLRCASDCLEETRDFR
ncbi:hypothetical protein SAMN04488123_10686 [Natribacillus halophilus]|uniref:Uncharacterized protein n=1 Tax=Natribacillus halophilus TaxID=549003 RepID=A0A1G8NJC1_9BACI|nr:hypothetical protein SAMN04488123_10686 [Natribacillus halophilus]